MPEVIANIPFLTYLWESITIESVIKFCILYFFIVWIAIIIWVIKDIANRTHNIFIQILSILIVLLFTPFGIFLYLLIRPSSTLFERYYQEVEENLDILSRMIEQKTEYQVTNGTSDCPSCGYEVERDFIICPNCKFELKHTCHSCEKEIRENWKVCPFCSTKQPKKKSKK